METECGAVHEEDVLNVRLKLVTLAWTKGTWPYKTY